MMICPDRTGSAARDHYKRDEYLLSLKALVEERPANPIARRPEAGGSRRKARGQPEGLGRSPSRCKGAGLELGYWVGGATENEVMSPRAGRRVVLPEGKGRLAGRGDTVGGPQCGRGSA
jgi:hypothetical protein